MSANLDEMRRLSEPPAEMPRGMAPPRLPPTVESTIPTVKTPEEAASLAPGSEFYDPAGKRRVVPHEVTDDTSYEAVPPGASYREKGKVQTKWAPDASFSTQAMALYDMAHTTEGRKKALEYVYGPGSVKEDRGELYVETPEGKRLSAKASKTMDVGRRALGAVAGGALPVAGSALGALGGGALGALAGPVGAVGGGVSGGAAGGAAGEYGNQQILKTLGVEKLSTPQAAGELGSAALTGGVGTLAGGVLPVLPGAVKTAATKYAPGFLRWLGGVDPAAMKVAGQIAAEGGRVPLSSYAPELPFASILSNIAKQFGFDPVRKTAEKEWLPKVTGSLLTNVGVPEAERQVVGRTSAVPFGEAGEAAKAKAVTMLSDARKALDEKVAGFRTTREQALKEGLRTEQRDIATQQTSLVTSADQMRAAANKIIAQDIKELDRRTAEAVAQAGANPGDLSRAYGEQIVKLRGQLGKDAGTLYRAADELAGDAQPNIAPIRQWAKALTQEVPMAVKAQYPEEVKLLERLGGGEEAKSGLLGPTGEPLAAPVERVTFGDLHQLRNFIRSKVDWGDLTRGPKQGLLAKVDQEINQVLYDAEAAPELQAAATQLRAADDFYRENIRKFEDSTVRRIAAFHRAAAPADAEELAALALHSEGRINRERIRLIRDMGGQDLWRSVVAADSRDMLNAAGYQTGRVDPARLAAEIGQRVESGALKEAYPAADAERLRLQADRISRVTGKVPMEAREGDTVFSLMDRADAALRRAEEMATKHPVETFNAEMAKVKAAADAMRASGKAEITKDPLHDFVSLEAEAAANKIVETPSLLKSVAMRFGTESPEFVALRRAAARRYMQDIADAVAPAAGRPGSSVAPIAEKFFSLTDEAQELLFPGVTKDQMTNLMRKIVMMFPPGEADFGSSLAGRAMLFNPQRATFVPKAGQTVLKAMPKWVARFGVAKMLSTIANITTSPELVRFIAQGLDGRPPGQEAAETLLRSILETGPLRAGVSAGVAETGLEAQKETDNTRRTSAGEPVKLPTWRERAAAGRASPPPPSRIPSWRERARQAP